MSKVKTILDYAYMTKKQLEKEYALQHRLLFEMLKSKEFFSCEIDRQRSIVNIIVSILDMHYKLDGLRDK